MKRAKVYIETTIPSFYYEIRERPDMVARRNWTRDWWDNSRESYDILTSIPVVEELEAGNHPCKQDCLEFIKDVPLLPVPEAIINIVETYIQHHLMPSNPGGDAIHLALASYHACDFLLTWNCAHLANANKQEHIRHVNGLLGLRVPVLTTPLELIKEPGEE
jgi:hypothetical protein